MTIKGAVVLFFASAALQAQTAQVAGTVKDAGGAPVPGALVTATGVSTGTVLTATTGSDGAYKLSGVPPGSYTLDIAKEGFQKFETSVALQANAVSSVDASLHPASGPSLSDLGFGPAQTQGSAGEQARLDKRSQMLRMHQRLGLITLAPLVATLVTANGAKLRHGTVEGRDLHAALGATTAGLYFTTASFAILAPKIPDTHAHGPIRVHKALAWIHGSGMVLLPILGVMAYNQVSNGQKVHGIAQAHAPVAWVTTAAYGAAILSVSIKF